MKSNQMDVYISLVEKVIVQPTLSRMLPLVLCLCLVVVVGTEDVWDTGCTQVQLREEAMCEDREVEDCGKCSTALTKNCMISMKKVLVPHKYKMCKTNQGKCLAGVRRSCRTR